MIRYYRISPSNSNKRLVSILHQNTTQRCCSTASTAAVPLQRESLRDKIHRGVKSSNFKYWFIGGTAFFSWCTYYGIKTYKKSRVDIEILPPLPTHATVTRNTDIENLLERYNQQTSLFGFGGEKIKKLLIMGTSGSGKTILAHDLAKQVMQKRVDKYLGFPKSQIIAFLQGDSEESFLLSLKAFAASELSEVIDQPFNEALFDEQCKALISCIREKTKKHPDWVVVLDNVQMMSPRSVVDTVNRWFLSDDEEESWSRGSVIVVHDGIERGKFNIEEKLKHMNYG